MSIFSRFFGNKADDLTPNQLVANPSIKSPLSLQVLFSDIRGLSSKSVTDALRSYHRDMSDARCEIEAQLNSEGKILGMAGWGNHVIRLVGFDLPMPEASIEQCIMPSHYPQELKNQARQHKSHILLFYGGYETSPLEQYVALAATAGVLAKFGAIVVLNEAGCTSFPAEALSGSDSNDDMLELLRSLPLPVLFCGFVKYEVDNVEGVWMRTHGANRLSLPNFASHAVGHEEGQRYFDLFENIFRYLLDSGAILKEGHTMQVGQDEYLRVRLANENENFIKSDDELLVAEIITEAEINRPD